MTHWEFFLMETEIIKNILSLLSKCLLHQKKNNYKRKELKFITSTLFAVRTGLEPVTSCVTGRHSNQLN